MILDFIKSTNFLINKTKMFFISLIVSILFSVIASQGAYAIPSEYLTNGILETSTFSGSPITNAGFGDRVINDGTFDQSGSTNQQISLLGTLDAKTIQDQAIDNKTIQEQAIDNNNIYKIWSDNTTSSNNEILFVKSTDGGKSFTDPKNISNNTSESINPAIAVSGNTVYVAWSDNTTSSNNEILFVKSTDAGANFTDPENISNNAGTSENPAIAVSGNSVYMAWSDNTSYNSPPDCSSADSSPSSLWPPNRNMQSIDIVGLTDPDGENVSINIDRITQDEPTRRNNGDPSWPDGEIIGTSIAKVKAEREVGHDNDGRVYRINFTASDSSGATCSGSVTVEVPPNPNREAIDSGQKYDSTKPNQLIDNNIQNVRSDNTSGNNEILFVKSTDAGANFTDPENISHNAGSSENPAIAVSGNAVYVAWSYNTSSNNEILFVKSTDAGANFTDPENISNNAGTSENPVIAVSGNAVYVAWSNSASNSEIFFIKSTDAGANFTDPENISNNAGTSENPVIAVSGNSVYVVWIDTTSGNNQVPIAVSENAGENFSTPIIISNNADAISNPQITIFGDNVSITWIDNSSGTNKILIAESTNGGNSFNAPRTVSNNPYVYVTWLEDNGNTGLGDAFIAVSNNTGATFNTQNLSIVDSNSTYAADVSNPIVFGSNVYATWIQSDVKYGESDAFIAVSNDNGTSFNRQNLSIVDPNRPTAVYPLNKPVVSGDNVYVTWREGDFNTDETDPFIAVSNDNGASFTTQNLSIVGPNGRTDLDSIREPVVYGDNVYVTWIQGDFNTGERDAFIAVSNDNGASFIIQNLNIKLPNSPNSVFHISKPVVYGDNVYVTWIEDNGNTGLGDAFIAVSNDNGLSFTTQNLSIEPNGPTDLDSISEPVVSGDNVYVTWSEEENANTNFDDLFIAVSNDNGQIFTPQNLSIVHPNHPTDIMNINNLGLLPVVSGNNVYVTWLEQEDGNHDINDAFIAVSNNTGQTFNTTRLSIADPNGLTNADHITNPVVLGSSVYVTWIERSNATNGERDAFIAVSNNTGQTFKTRSLSIADPNGPTRIDEDNRISPPRVSGSNLYVTWDEQPTTLTGDDPFIAVYNNTGQTFNTTSLSISNPHNRGTDFPVNSPVVSGSSVYVTWIEEPSITRESDAFIAISNDTGQTFNTTRLSNLDPGTRANNIINNPVVSGDNIYVTWREDKYNHPPFLQNAFIAVSNDNGASFKTEGLSIFGQESLGNVRSIGNPVVP